MRLWVEGKEGSPGNMIRAKVSEVKADVNCKVISRATRAVNCLRNAELEVLRGQRNGRVYRKPHTKRATYTASAPGEPPARRTGNLRLHWNGDVKTEPAANGMVSVFATLESGEKYAGILENGTDNGKIAPRPFKEKIKEKAEPEIRKIYGEPYT